MNQQFLSLLQTEKFDIKDLEWIDERTLVVTKWNWDYASALDFQRRCVKLLGDFPRNRVLICCNHPRVFTHGRGLQKPRKGEVLELKDFDLSKKDSLPYPLYEIERGGGLTFHHPGQFIFYPILKLNPASLSLSTMIDEIFQFSKEVLEDWGINEVSSENKLLGLWRGQKKLASMGIAIEKLTTFHGMALNLFWDEEMMKALRAINPCGLEANTYSSVDQFVDLPENALHEFKKSFIQKVKHGWQ
jgi:lipoyl(octanoyl) transferase